MITHSPRPPHVVLADHFAQAGACTHPLRIRLTSGEQFDCYRPHFDVDELVLSVTTYEGVVRNVRAAEVQAIFERRPRLPVYAGVSLAAILLGAGICALVVPFLAPLTAVDGASIGGLAGALGAAVLLLPTLNPVAYPRLVEHLGGFVHWRAVFPKADA